MKKPYMVVFSHEIFVCVYFDTNSICTEMRNNMREELLKIIGDESRVITDNIERKYLSDNLERRLSEVPGQLYSRYRHRK